MKMNRGMKTARGPGVQEQSHTAVLIVALPEWVSSTHTQHCCHCAGGPLTRSSLVAHGWVEHEKGLVYKFIIQALLLLYMRSFLP